MHEMTRRPKIAALVSVYHKHAHAQHIVDRFLEGYGWNGRHHRPPMDVVALYVDQAKPKPAEPKEGDRYDLAAERAARFPQLSVYPTVADALTLGGSRLAVDGVLLIGEHGDYPVNDRGQTLWPRYQFFRQVVSVFGASGRAAPVFCDKHLSWNFAWAREMVDTSVELGFPLMAGSSLPVTRRLPPVEMPLGAQVEEALCVGCGWIDGGDFHGYETIQAMVERRRGGETGVRWIQAFRGESFWEALEAERWSRALVDACLCRGTYLAVPRAGFNHVFPTVDEMRRLVPDPWAYQYEHADGLRCTMIAMNGLFGGSWAFAARLRGRQQPLSTYMDLPMPPGLANFFSPLVNNIERMFLTGRAPYPIERTLLTTGLTAAGVESLHQGQKRVDTPQLAIAYAAPEESTFWRT
jgi:hypothetical protein